LSKYSKVKLYIYEHTPKETIIDTVECREWDEIVIAAYSFDNVQVSLEELMDTLSEAFANKKVVLVPKQSNIEFYGVKEMKELEHGS